MRRLWLCSVFTLGCFIAPREVEVGTVKLTVERSKPPRVHWLIDNSGSMLFPIDANDSHCPAGCGNGTACPADCPTRKAVFDQVFAGLMNAHGSNARHSVTVFPSLGGVCEAGAAGDHIYASAETDDAAALATSASAATVAVSALAPQGGTPTSSALEGLRLNGSVAASNDRAALVVLVTDGLPNCNAQNPVSCAAPSLCRCTLTSCAGSFCTAGCLDDLNTLKAIADLRTASGAEVLVVGLGPELLGGDGADTLNAMAETGGLPRTCPGGTNEECGMSRCLGNAECQVRNESVQRVAGLTPLSLRLDALLKSHGPCRLLTQDIVTESSNLDVRVNGQLTTEWRVDRPGLVTLTGVACETVAADADASVEIRPKPAPL